MKFSHTVVWQRWGLGFDVYWGSRYRSFNLLIGPVMLVAGWGR